MLVADAVCSGSCPQPLLITGRIRVHGIGGGHKQRYRMIDFLRFRPEQDTQPGPFKEKVITVRYDPCRQVWDGDGAERLLCKPLRR